MTRFLTTAHPTIIGLAWGYCTDSRIVLDLGKEIKKHAQNDNMLAWQYNTIGVSDGITMGGEGIRNHW